MNLVFHIGLLEQRFTTQDKSLRHQSVETAYLMGMLLRHETKSMTIFPYLPVGDLANRVPGSWHLSGPHLAPLHGGCVQTQH